MEKDWYLVLQLTPRATSDEIRSAYRRRALELHPDISGSGSEPFLELQEAYSVLSDPIRRAAYDRGVESIPIHRFGRAHQSRASAEPFQEVEPASAFREVSLSQSFGKFIPTFDDVFERFWRNFEPAHQPKGEGLETLTVDIPLTRQEAWRGGTVRILVPAREVCHACRGRGGIGWHRCWRCRGQGIVQGEFPLDINYPTVLSRDYVVRVRLNEFGIKNLYLTVRFRPSDVV